MTKTELGSLGVGSYKATLEGHEVTLIIDDSNLKRFPRVVYNDITRNSDKTHFHIEHDLDINAQGLVLTVFVYFLGEIYFRYLNADLLKLV